MISVTVVRNRQRKITAFTANNHGRSEVCAAVSLMVLNTVNSIEALTGEPFSCDYDENGGFITFSLTGTPERESGLLLESMLLGLRSVQEQYKGEIEITDTE